VLITGLVDKVTDNVWVTGIVLLVCNVGLIGGVSLLMGRAQRRKELAAEGAALR
jgi:hypothetical protein